MTHSLTRACASTSSHFIRSGAILLVLWTLAANGSLARDQEAAKVAGQLDTSQLEAMQYRNIGPFRGGRVTAVTGVVGERETFYMGSTGGGVWKTSDGGQIWRNISDEFFSVASIGAVAVAPSDPNVLYVGSGSACPRGNISPGNGVYRSTDGGKTWTHSGLEQAGQIGAIIVHPDDSQRLYVAALGHIFGPNPERGVYRSLDGGKSWEHILRVSDRAGAVDLSMNRRNPRILFAAIWEAQRSPWTMTSGGEESGLYRSADGGDSWEEVTQGLPDGIKGRIGVSVSAADPNRVFALVEAENGGLFRSDDGGNRFRLINPDRNFRQRAWYYTHVFADPVDADTVYIANVGLWRSIDAGKSFSYIRAPHGDHHALWINPEDAQVLINGNDGGANISYNGGSSWSTQGNQPTAEMYRVTVDDQFPYRVYGCQQDNSCVSVPSRTSSPSIERQDWYEIGGCESGHVAVDPRDPNVSYAGCYGGEISRYDHATDQNREIMAYPQLAVGQAARDLKYRFQWNAPIRLSPHDPSVLYHTSQFVHRSRNEGQSWEVISPDLTRNDADKQDYAGGPLTLDNTGVEVYGTIFAFEESPLVEGLLWAGTDDGRVHLSRDHGETWQEITPPTMPDWGQVNMIELSAHDPGRAFLAVTRYRLDDFRPFIFRTDDYGQSWKLLTAGGNGIAADHFTRVVREDPHRKGILYAGTEFGIYISFDDGESWQSFQLNLPVTPVTDLALKNEDLVVATQGRSFWILDDLTPLHQLDEVLAGSEPVLFSPRVALRFGGGFAWGQSAPAGANPRAGATIHYWLPSKPESEIILEILDPSGNVLRTLSSQKEERQAPSPWRQFVTEEVPSRLLPANEGLNRWVWDLRLPDAELVDNAVLWGSARGPRVAPGPYRVRLTIGEWSASRDFEVAKDPRLAIPDEDLEAQFALARQVWEGLSASHRTLASARELRQQIDDLMERIGGADELNELQSLAAVARERLDALIARIYQTKTESSQDILNFPPQLDGQLVGLLGTISGADARPTAGAEARWEDLQQDLAAVTAEFDAILAGTVHEFNQAVRDLAIPAVIVPDHAVE